MAARWSKKGRDFVIVPTNAGNIGPLGGIGAELETTTNANRRQRR